MQPLSSSIQSRWIWPFEILEQIGEGGMGVVYRARYVVNGRNVALKMVPGDVTDKTALARFERELEVLKTLRHPNIVRCFGGICEDKRRFYAMELIEGGSLEDKLQQKGKFSWEQVVYYGLQMCAALECSHQKGVVHRDVKPSNFLITPSGELKLSDFGLASVIAARKITAAGKTAGTFLYMAPEQIRGQEVTPRTDLYALGCVLYELVTGQVPFLGETAGATLHLHCHTPPSRPSEKTVDCPVSLEKIILSLLEKNPEDRPQSATEVANRLRTVNQTITVTPSRSEKFLEAQAPLIEKPAPKTSPLVAEKTLPTWAIGSLISALAVMLLLSMSLWSQLRTAKQWRSHWQTAATSADLPTRITALNIIGQMTPQDSAGMETLIKAMDDPETQIRMAAVSGLKFSGTAGKTAVPALMRVQKTDPREEIRVAADETLKQIRHDGRQAGFSPGRIIMGLILLGAAGAGAFYWWKQRQPTT